MQNGLREELAAATSQEQALRSELEALLREQSLLPVPLFLHRLVLRS